MPLPSGTRVGPYELIERLGAGGMGEVFRARDTRLDRVVALKLLPADLSPDPERLRRFEQEARSASALNHPAIVTIYDLGQFESQPYISMELVVGLTLRDMLGPGPLPVRRALEIGAQIADGLAKAHDVGIVHRDLKPENIMVTDDGFAKILDFGLAKLTAGSDLDKATGTFDQRGTRPGMVMGTAGYMSPEQAGGTPVDFRSDQFSFGATLYEMLSGRRAFERQTAVEAMSAIVRDEPQPLAQISPHIPSPVRWIVERCLAKRPADRYASTRDLARDLATARDRLSELTTPVAASELTATALPAMRGRERLAWALVAVLAAAGIASAFCFSTRTPVPETPVTRFTIPTPGNRLLLSSAAGSPLAMSPDGLRLAMVVALPNGETEIWVRALDSLDARLIPGTRTAATPFWSPDGESLGFFLGGKLKRVSVTSGDVQTICDAGYGGGASWSRNGVIIFAANLEGGLSRVAAVGGTPVPLANPAAGAQIWPMFLPDGRRFMYRGSGGSSRPFGVYVGSLDSSEVKALKPVSMDEASPLGFTEPDYLLFVRGRTLVAQKLNLDTLEPAGEPFRVAEGVNTFGPAAAFSVSPNGRLAYWSGGAARMQLTWLDRAGKSVGTLGPPMSPNGFALSPDERQVALGRTDVEPQSIWAADVARATLTRLTLQGRFVSTPVWAHDGKSILFAAAVDSPPNLYSKHLNPIADDERLTRSPFQSFPDDWSRDGSLVVYRRYEPSSGSDLFVMSMKGDRKSQPLIQTASDEYGSRISPDGQWLVYVSNESGRDEVYITSFPKLGARFAVSSGGGTEPQWRPDGRELFYWAFAGAKTSLMAAGVDPGPPLKIAKPAELFEVSSFRAGPGPGPFYDVSANGRFLIGMPIKEDSQPVNIVLNWPAGVAPR